MARPRIHGEPRIATAVRLPAWRRRELRRVATAGGVPVHLVAARAVADHRGPAGPDRGQGPA